MNQKIVTVPAYTDELANAAIDEQNAIGWIAVQIFAIGESLVILFTKTAVAA